LAKNISSDLRTEDSGFLSPAFRLFGGEKAEINGACFKRGWNNFTFCRFCSYIRIVLLFFQQMALRAFILRPLFRNIQ